MFSFCFGLVGGKECTFRDVMATVLTHSAFCGAFLKVYHLFSTRLFLEMLTWLTPDPNSQPDSCTGFLQLLLATYQTLNKHLLSPR